MDSPYIPLGTYLRNQPVATTTVTLALTDIEQVLGRPLPPGAWARGWWHGARGYERPRAWRVAGWRVVGVSMRIVTPTVTFARLPADSTG